MGGVFFVNAASYLAVLGALLVIRVRPAEGPARAPSPRAIAEALQASEAQIKTWLHRARARLAGIMADDDAPSAKRYPWDRGLPSDRIFLADNLASPFYLLSAQIAARD